LVAVYFLWATLYACFNRILVLVATIKTLLYKNMVWNSKRT